MKNLFKVSASFLLVLGLVGCGESSSVVGGAKFLSINTSKQVEHHGNTMGINFSVKSSYPSDVNVSLSNMKVSVTPSTCKIKGEPVFTPSNLILNGAETKNVNALVEFENRCNPTSYQLSGTSILTQNGKSNELSFASPVQSLSEDTNGSTATAVGGVSTTPTTHYEFKNVPEKIVISKPNEKRSFRVQLIDEADQVVSGKSVSISSYDIRYGEMESMKVVTDAKGFANFSFTSPSSLSRINGQELVLNLNYIENKSIVLSTTVNLSFRASDAPTESSNYKFQNATSLTIGHASEKQTLSIDLLDAEGVGVSGKTIKITTLDSKFGSFSSSTAQTNGAGRASFSYTSPEDFKSLDGKSTSVALTFTEDGVSITQKVTISFHKSTNNIPTDKVLPTVVIPSSLRDITLESNSKSIEIQIRVFKDTAPYTKGTVKVELPSKVLNGVDVGSFSSFEVPVNEQGIATFNYTGPANLKALLDANDKSSVFKFYHSENSDASSRQEMVVNYSASADTYIPIDYTVSINTDNDFSMGIPNLQKTFKVVLKDSKGNTINDSDIEISKIVVRTENALVARILDTNANIMVDSLELKKENNSAFILKSKKLSGIVPLKVVINFKDINGKDTELSTIVNVRVMSGPPSAISVSYVSTGKDAERAKYEEKFAISVTDEYGNKVNTQPYISLGAIVGYAVDGESSSSVESSNTKRLYYSKSAIENSTANGIIDTLGDEIANTTHFEDNTDDRSDVFKWVNAEGKNTDKLVVFGKGKNYEAMGKWDFHKIDNNTLALEDDYFGADRSELYYAVGHNYYQDQCLEDGREWIGNTDSESYQLDEEGTVLISYKYDYHLTGKDALVWVNLNGYQSDTGKNTRIGEVTKHTLRGMGLDSRPSGGYSIDKNSTAIVTFNIHHTDNAEWYRNGHFGYEIAKNTCEYSMEIDSINRHDARSCNNGGVASVTFQVKAPEDASCTFNIKNILVANEF